MSRIKRPTVKIVLMKHKTLLNGENPVALRVTFDRKSKYFVLKDESKTLTCALTKWNNEFGRFNRNNGLNILLNAYEKKANDKLKNLTDTDFTFSRFENLYFKSSKRIDVYYYFQECIENLKNENRLGSANCYKDTHNRLNEFTKRRKMNFQDMDTAFLKRFEKYLEMRGNSVNSIGIYLRTLRAVYNKAIEENHVNKDLYPFINFKIKSGYSINRALSKESIKLLIKYKPKRASSRWHSLNYFIFSYLCRGMNFKDLAGLQWKENIFGDKLYYIRAKTANTKRISEPTIIKLEPQMAKILGYYSKNDPYIFPFLEPGISEITKRYRLKDKMKIVNKDIKDIATELGLPEADQITFYWARHTYATVLKRSGVPTAIISEALGHSNEKTTQAYLDKFENEQLDDTYQHLI